MCILISRTADRHRKYVAWFVRGSTVYFRLLSYSRTPSESPIGTWGLHSHQTSPLPLLIPTPESQESGPGSRARHPSLCHRSCVHLGTGQVELILTHLSLIGKLSNSSLMRIFIFCALVFVVDSHGQLGHGGLTSEEEPTAVEALWGMPMSCVATGGWHSVCVSGKRYAKMLAAKRVTPLNLKGKKILKWPLLHRWG